jgi:hypothetical protein
MPILEQHEEQLTSVWRRVEVTDEQAEEIKQLYEKYESWASRLMFMPDWVWDLDWDLHWDKAESDETLSIDFVDEE